jgi:methyl-accepting chemotaxis protein
MVPHDSFQWVVDNMKWTLRPGKKEDTAPAASAETRNAAERVSDAVSKIGAGLTRVSITRSVGLKLFAIIFISIVVCVYGVGLFAYETAKDIIESKMMDASKTTISQTAGKLNLQLANMENLYMSVMLDQTIQVNSRNLAYSDLSDFEQYQNVQGIETSFNNFLFGNSKFLVGGALLPLRDGLSPIVSATTRIDQDEAVESEWYKRAIESDVKGYWLPTMPNGLAGNSNKKTFGFAKIVRSTSTNDPIYLLLLEFNYQVVHEQFADVSLGEGSVIRIINSDGTVLFGPDEEIGQPLGIGIGESAEADAITAELDGESVLVPYQTLDNGWTLVGTVPVGELVKDAAVIRNVMFGTLGFAALLAAGIGLLVIWMIALPLAKLRNLMNEGEKGNLTVRSNIRKRDEIGQLALSFNQMMERITELVNRTNESAAQVLRTAENLSEASRKTALSAKEIAVATEEIANGATSLAVEAERGSDLTEKMSEKMREVNEARDQMAASASDVEKASEQGTRYMASLIEKTGMTEEMTRNMVEKVDRLKESTRSIRQILDVLNNITKQTNILSLNATIEAARAGAAGKGFMVVADEIRKLADQSRESIDVVASITETIQNEIESTVSVLGEAYPIFQEQIDSVKEANQIFLSVQAQMNAFTAHLETVNESVAQLGQTQAVLSEAMGNVSAVAQQSSATSEEVASLSNEQLNVSENLVVLSGELEKVSAHLKETLSHFRTDDGKRSD